MIRYDRMNQCHTAQVAALEKICFSDPWSENSVLQELENPLSLWLVAMDGDTLAGYVGSQTVLGEADMMNVAVSPDYRRQGIAEGLVKALISQLDAHSLTLEVRSSNAAAIALYDKLGFLEIGRRRNYYRKPKEDALILRKQF